MRIRLRSLMGFALAVCATTACDNLGAPTRSEPVAVATGGGGLSVVQSRGVNFAATGSGSVSFATPPTVGNYVIVVVDVWMTWTGAFVPGVSHLSDNQGHTYTLDYVADSVDEYFGYAANHAYYRTRVQNVSGTFAVTLATGLGIDGYGNVTITEVHADGTLMPENTSTGVHAPPFQPIDPLNHNFGPGTLTSGSAPSIAFISASWNDGDQANGPAVPVTGPSGWTEIFHQQDNAIQDGSFYYRILSGSTPVTPMWNGSWVGTPANYNSDHTAGVIYVDSGTAGTAIAPGARPSAWHRR